MMNYSEQGLVFPCGSNRLVGVAAIPETSSDVGVLIMVGGPQYRVGSHRQFTLLARHLAGAGFASLRFDYSGMGDSEGERSAFDKNRDDVTAAIDALCEMSPKVSRVVLWGLCDAASSAMMLAHQDNRVSGMVLLNPWVHTGEYSPEVKLSHFYRPLFTQRDHWRRLLSGKIQLLPALKELAGDAFALLGNLKPKGAAAQTQRFYVDEMLEGLQRFEHAVMLILSENDLTAREFTTLVANDKNWKSAMRKPGIDVRTIAGADHTFSQRPAQGEVEEITADWLRRFSNSE